MALINAQATIPPIVEPWGTINHHYLLQGFGGPDGIDLAGLPVNQLETDNFQRVPNILVPIEKQAEQVTSFTDYWYNQIFVTPPSQDVGNVSSTVTYQVEVWNGFFQNRVLSTIEELNAEGINVLNGIPAGTPYLALQSSVYDIEVTPDGPPTIEAIIRWVFGADLGFHTIVGNRLVLFPFKAAGPVSESLKYRTNIIQAFSAEQRIALIKAPRQEWGMRYKNSDPAIQSRLNSAMWGRNIKQFGLPIWTDVTYFLDPIPIGTTVFNIDTRFFDYRDGGLMLIYTDDLTNEAAEIATVTDSSITLVRPTETEFPNGAILMPVLICEASGGLQRSDIGNDVNLSSILFRAVDNLELESTPAVTYLGYEVYEGFNIRPNGQVSGSIILPQATIDAGTGPWDTYEFRSITDETWEYSLAADNAEDRWNNKLFIERQRGQQKSFWVSTRRKDFVIVTTLAASSVAMEVENMGQQFRDLEGSIFHVEFALKDGTIYRRQIIGLQSETADKQFQTVEFNTALGVEYQPDEFERVSYLRLMRFQTDDIEIVHNLGIYSEVSIPLITVEQPAA